jgi:hypothetical protein
MKVQADFMNIREKLTFTGDIKSIKITRNITLKED